MLRLAWVKPWGNVSDMKGFLSGLDVSAWKRMEAEAWREVQPISRVEMTEYR
jgi:hypothetical protein